jgi:hypothetical protein
MWTIKNDAVKFGRQSGRQLAVIEKEVAFNGLVSEAHVALTGFRAEYDDGKDEHVRILKVTTEIVREAIPAPVRTVKVKCQLWIADKNNDNPFVGSIYFAVFANLINTGDRQ